MRYAKCYTTSPTGRVVEATGPDSIIPLSSHMGLAECEVIVRRKMATMPWAIGYAIHQADPAFHRPAHLRAVVRTNL